MRRGREQRPPFKQEPIKGMARQTSRGVGRNSVALTSVQKQSGRCCLIMASAQEYTNAWQTLAHETIASRKPAALRTRSVVHKPSRKKLLECVHGISGHGNLRGQGTTLGHGWSG
jgi:hypothetical protein